MKKKAHLLVLLYLLWPICCSHAFYLAGFKVQTFAKGDTINVETARLTSTRTQHPYDYYSLPFWRPANTTSLPSVASTEGIFHIMENSANTSYSVRMVQNSGCVLLGDKMNQWKSVESNKAIELIQNEYSVNLFVDYIPAASKIQKSASNGDVDASSGNQIDIGYPLGRTDGNNVYINNHLKFILSYHKSVRDGKDVYYVVGFEIEPISVNEDSYNFNFEERSCNITDDAKPQPLIKDTSNEVFFTYSVEWKESAVTWDKRWDAYLRMSDAQISWYRIIMSILVVFLLSGILLMIVANMVRRDIERFNSKDISDETLATPGWISVRGDVFRPITKSDENLSLIGFYTQLIFSISTITLIAMLRIIPAFSGVALIFELILIVAMSAVCGYVCTRLQRTLANFELDDVVFLNILYYHVLTIAWYIFTNFYIGIHFTSDKAFFCFCVLLSLFVSVLAMFFGVSMGHRKPPYQDSVTTNEIPRQVPKQPWYAHSIVCTLVSGIIPFGVVFIQKRFIFANILQNQVYYECGLLFILFCTLVISIATTSIVTTFYQLRREDYRWKRTFNFSAGFVVYFYFYTVFNMYNHLSLNGFPAVFVYVAHLISLFIFAGVTGAIGYLASYFFVRRIYGALANSLGK